MNRIMVPFLACNLFAAGWSKTSDLYKSLVLNWAAANRLQVRKGTRIRFMFPTLKIRRGYSNSSVRRSDCIDMHEPKPVTKIPPCFKVPTRWCKCRLLKNISGKNVRKGLHVPPNRFASGGDTGHLRGDRNRNGDASQSLRRLVISDSDLQLIQ